MTSRRLNHMLLAVMLSTAFILAASGCSGASTSGTGGSTSGGATVIEKNFQFSPSNLTVQTGDKVTFDNQDSAPHHVFVGTIDLGEQQPGRNVTWTAGKNGTFPVKCIIHASMTGQITVGSGGGTGGPGAPTGGGSSAPAPSGGY